MATIRRMAKNLDSATVFWAVTRSRDALAHQKSKQDDLTWIALLTAYQLRCSIEYDHYF